MFRFANPQYLWLLCLVPAMTLLFAWSLRRRRRRLARFGNPETLRELMPEVSTGRVVLKFVLFAAAVGLLALAAARPQFGSKLREERAQGIEMMIAVDVSNSMLAEDFEPNRLERTKYALDKLFDGLRQDRVGLIVFAGEPKVQLPVTSDHRMAKAFARRIDPSQVAVQGTAIGKALEQALLSFSGDGEGRSRAVILITDGENHDDDAIAVARRAAEAGIRIYTIGIGTPEGAPIAIDGEFITDEKGDMVVSKLDEATLARIADLTDGAYVRASKQSIGLEEIVKSINDMERSELSTLRFEEYDEQYRIPLAAALRAAARRAAAARPPQPAVRPPQHLPRKTRGVIGSRATFRTPAVIGGGVFVWGGRTGGGQAERAGKRRKRRKERRKGSRGRRRKGGKRRSRRQTKRREKTMKEEAVKTEEKE